MTVALELHFPSAGTDADRSRLGVAWNEYTLTRSHRSRDLLVTHYMRAHVQPLVTRFRSRLPHHVELDDLLQQAAFGLMECLERFDPGRDIKFETFSARRIVGALVDHLRRVDPVSRQSRQAERLLRTTVECFEKTHGRAPTDAETRALLGMNETVFQRFLRQARIPGLLPMPSRRSESGDIRPIDAIESARPAPGIGCEERDTRRWLLEGLTREDKLIITLYYYENLSLREIGVTLGISESRVSQKKDEILGAMRARLGREERAADQPFHFISAGPV